MIASTFTRAPKKGGEVFAIMLVAAEAHAAHASACGSARLGRRVGVRDMS
jgi:hypothetical protein